MTDLLHTLALILLGWLGLGVAVCWWWYHFLAPRRAERRYRRWER